MYILYIVFVQIDCCIWGLDYVFGGGVVCVYFVLAQIDCCIWGMGASKIAHFLSLN